VLPKAAHQLARYPEPVNTERGQIAAHHPPEPGQILLIKRAVEAEFDLTGRPLLRRFGGSRMSTGSRNQMNEPEHDDRDAEQDQNRVQQAKDDEPSHDNRGERTCGSSKRCATPIWRNIKPAGKYRP